MAMHAFVLVLALCDPGEALLNATLWVQTSAEYRASALQSYAIARQTLDDALSARSTRPAAIILDLDETALDNSRFAARQLKKGQTFTFGDEWTSWVNETASSAVPGAVELVQYAQSRGVTPFYITNRKTMHEAATRAMLEKLGFALRPDTLLVRRDNETSDKSARRASVAARYRVLLYLGDAMSDFPSNDDGVPRIIVPNPMYGSWESAPLKPGATPPLPSRSPCGGSR
ncbi:MAG TPA: HAD family acid phosphatase [Thermoanaerobaculia bacterium]|jgi:acid phosphatase|nr:HAD family acid phosphatase [Thermoanaerobaculia bacterium]